MSEAGRAVLGFVGCMGAVILLLILLTMLDKLEDIAASLRAIARKEDES